MAQHEYFTDKIYQLYYDEVGKHSIISPAEERKLLIQYHTCPHCNLKLPPKIKATNCPECGTVAPKNLEGRDYICEECSDRFSAFTVPTICPRCGSPRDNKAREKLITSNLRFVIRRAKSYSQKPEHLRKLISAGNVGLMIAIDKFNIKRETRFLTYAEWWIRKEMLDEMHASNLIHVPTHRQKTLRREQKEGKYVCRHCGLRTETLDVVKYLSRCTEIEHDFKLPLNSHAGALGDAVSLDDVALQTNDNTEAGIVGDDMECLLRDTLRRMPLSERDRFIVAGYFNVPQPDRKGESKTLPQLAALTGITPERVRQIKEQTLELLKRELKKLAINSVKGVYYS